MERFFLKYLLIFFSIFLLGTIQTEAQRIKKVKVNQRIVAYDEKGKVIDSLSRNIKNQSEAGKFLDKVQVDLREVELQMEKYKNMPEDDAKKEELEKERDELVEKNQQLIKQLQDDKKTLVKDYYIVIESLKDKQTAKVALRKWKSKGVANPFMFNNKIRKWFYICAGIRKTYRQAIQLQFDLQKRGIESWIYYWAE